MTIQHLNPYRETAQAYRQKNWAGVLPIPYGEKHPPPTGFTGHAAPYPAREQIEEWMGDGKRYNICLRLAGVDKDHEIIGIDVDHYVSGEKDKKGGDQLDALEERLGVLPPTWISTARCDGISGIRYYRVPRGLGFRGKIDKDIECIQKGHRFAVVAPSKHPGGETYHWFEPGYALIVDGWAADGTIPDARELPELPEAWLKYLTQGKMSAGETDRIDMDSSVDEIYAWADATFWDDPEQCRVINKAVEKHKQGIKDDATSHDKIVNAHFHILSLAAEGHIGWAKALNEIEQFWMEDVIARDKRGRDELIHEIWRSRTNALRKIKARVDGRIAIGAAPIDAKCTTGQCMTPAGVGSGGGGGGGGLANVVAAVTGGGIAVGGGGGGGAGSGGDPLADVPRQPARDPGDYRMNDDGNAEHFIETFSSAELGPSVRFAPGYGWIVWHTGALGRGTGVSHWQRDIDGNQEIRRMWQRIRDAQEIHVAGLKVAWENLVASLLAGTGGVTQDQVKAAKGTYEKWRRFAEMSGNNRNAIAAIEAVASVDGVSIDVNQLDANQYLMGVANGVLELDGENVRLRNAIPSDYITMNTGVPWEKPSQFAAGMWQKYLDTFLPDPELQRAVQIILGHCLVGGNPEKILLVLKGGTNTGKSTMVSAIENALGDYAGSINPAAFQQHKFNEVLVDALPKRVVMCSEFEEKDDLSAAMIKRITGGNDKITQAIKYSNAKISAVPQFVAILPTNETPKIEGNDEALKNRLLVIPFVVTPEKIDKTAGRTIPEVCKKAVLHWLVEGYMEYRRLGFLPRVLGMEEATEEFVAELDEAAAFVHEVVEGHPDRKKIGMGWTDKDWTISSDELYRRFKMWCDENDMPTFRRLTKNAFSRRMTAMGYAVKRIRIGDDTSRRYLGVRLRVNQRSRVVSLSNVQASLSGGQDRNVEQT